MPKFIKDDSSGSKESVVHSTKLKKEILSPLYFPPTEDRLSQKDVASMFGRTVQTICAWTKANKIPYFKLGEHPIYSRKQLVLLSSKNQSLLSDN